MLTTLQFKLILENRQNLEKVKELMRIQSSAVRFIYNRLKEGKSDRQAYQLAREKFHLPSHYVESALIKAKALPLDRVVVFGGKKLFEKLCRNHLQGRKGEKLKREWKEKRNGSLVSVGRAKEKGNRCLRFEDKEGELYLRISAGNRDFVYARVKRELSNEKDKWLTFLSMLFESWKTKNFFPYTVELKLKEGEVYDFVSFDYPVPEVEITKRYGVVAIDTNASPLHLAIAELSEDGNLVSYHTVSLHNFWQYSRERKGHEEWLIAHQIVDFAYNKGKAIAMEDLKKVSKGYRGDGKAKLRKRLHHWNFKGLLQKIERVARLKGIEVIKVYPAYTSIIGMLKYAPQLGIDKDIAGAYVIGRRVLGFEEEIPKNYEKLLEDKEFMQSAFEIYKQKKQRLKEELKKEKNKYKRSAIKIELKEVQKALQSLQSGPRVSGFSAYGRKDGLELALAKSNVSLSLWQVLRVALLFPVLGKALSRNLSPLKPVLVEGKWDRVRKGRDPFDPGGSISLLEGWILKQGLI